MKYQKGFVYDIFIPRILKYIINVKCMSYKAGVVCKCGAMNKNSWWGGNHPSLPPLAASLAPPKPEIVFLKKGGCNSSEELVCYYYLLGKQGFVFGGVYLFVRWSTTASNIT